MKVIKQNLIKFFVAVLAALLVMILMVGCNNTNKTKTQVQIDPYASVTAKAVVEQCNDPSEVYPILPITFPLEALVVRHSDCAGVGDMLMVIWPGENTERNSTAAELLVLMYVERANLVDQDRVLSSSFIKIDKHAGTEVSHIAIYELKTSKKVAPGPSTAK